MKRILALLALWLAAAGAFAATNKPPNILLILADDAGYADFGFQGGGINGDYAKLTPNLDRLATNGVRFSCGYVTQPYCCPSRAGLLTGRYQQRFGFENNIMTNAVGLPTTERTIANRLKTLGYRTYAVGKWHLGEQTRYHPNQRGFDEFYGFLSGARTYRRYQGDDNAEKLQTNGVLIPEVQGQYLTDVLGRAASNYIAAHFANASTNPFFMYLAFNAVHTPLEAYPEDFNSTNVQHILDPRRKANAAMTLALDRAVGVVLNKLTELGQRTNTLVVFLSDNGGPENGGEPGDLALESPNWSDNAPLRGRKTALHEGGIRVPFLMSWPGTIQTNSAGRVIDDPVISLDLLPTFFAAAGGTNSPTQGLDGVNLLPRLTGVTTNPIQRSLFWRSRLPGGELSAVRQGDWKLYRGTNGVPELYDLAADIGETKSLAEMFPEKVAELAAVYAEWERGVILPLWEFGSPNPSPGVRFTASPLGYIMEKTNVGPGRMTYELREPLSLSNDWSLTWSMESEDERGYERNGYIVLGDSRSTLNLNFIRAGLDLSGLTASIFEVQPATNTSRSIPGPIAGRYYLRLDFAAATRELVLRYGTNQPTVRYEPVRVRHTLNGNYGELSQMGYALQSAARTHFSPILPTLDPQSPGTSPSWTRLQMARDYIPGTRDLNGNFMGGTEIMSLVSHRERLFAGLSYWHDTRANPGAQMLVKDSAEAPWRVDKAFGTNFVRVECLRSITLTTDKNGAALSAPVTLLMAGVGGIEDGGSFDTNAYVFIRNDATSDWIRTIPGTVTNGQAGARLIFEHKDRKTGVHHVFCAYGETILVRGGYDASTGLIEWNSAAPELTGAERMLSGGDCNGFAYACIGSDGPNNTTGGVYWREDGANPVWHLILEFPDHPDEIFEDVRGFTAVPHPDGFGYEVGLFTLNSHSKVMRLDPIGGDPRNGHIITEELNIETFLGDHWDRGTPISDNIIAAYNDMPALPDPATAETVHFIGLFIKRHPAGTNTVEFNNAWYLIRRLDATYDWGLAVDPAYPLPNPNLRGCRAASLSPFPGETNRVLFVGGFDAGATENIWHNTAWLYRAQLPAEHSRIRMDGPTPVVGIDTTFHWNYQLEAAPALTNFQPIGPPLGGSNTVREVRHTNAPFAGDFYRWKISR